MGQVRAGSQDKKSFLLVFGTNQVDYKEAEKKAAGVEPPAAEADS